MRIIPKYKGDNLNIYNEKNIKDLEYEYKYTDIYTEDVSIHKEILRYKIIQKIVKIFITEMKKLNKYVDTTRLYKYNKLIELVQKWCWEQYNNKTQDYVIPYNIDNKYKYNEFVSNINNILKINLDVKNKIYINLDKKLIKYLKKSYNNFKNKEEKIVTLNKTIQDKIIISCIYDNRDYKINISKDLYDRLIEKYKMYSRKDIEEINKYIFCLVFRYSYLDSVNQQLAINNQIKYLFKEYFINFELFGSAINTISDNYCSLFYDIEKYFGSKGNVFNIKINKGIYWCNPIYDETIMEKIAIKICKILIDNPETAFIITVPIWDKYTQDKIKNEKIKYVCRNYNKDSNIEVHNDFKLYYLLKPYIKDELVIPKFRIPYFNHRLDTYIYAVNTYMLFVYNKINEIYVKDIHNVFSKIIELDKKDYFII